MSVGRRFQGPPTGQVWSWNFVHSEMESLEGLYRGASRSGCVLWRCLWLLVESGLQGKHDSCWGVTMKQFDSQTSGRPHSRQELIAALRFAEVETEAWGGEKISKAGIWGAGPGPNPALILLNLAACCSPSPLLSHSCGGLEAVLKAGDLPSSSSQKSGLWNQRAWVQAPSLPLHSCVTLSKPYSLSVPRFLHLQNGHNNDTHL